MTTATIRAALLVNWKAERTAGRALGFGVHVTGGKALGCVFHIRALVFDDHSIVSVQGSAP
jgi:hypothetical protein